MLFWSLTGLLLLITLAAMDITALQSKIAGWRNQAGLTQSDLDAACGFEPGTVARLEQERLRMTEEQFVRILLSMDRDLLWTLLEICGSLYKRLQPIEKKWRGQRKKSSPQEIWEDQELQESLTHLFSEARVVVTKLAKAADPKTWAIDLLLRAAYSDPALDPSVRKRVRKRRPKEQSASEENGTGSA